MTEKHDLSRAQELRLAEAAGGRRQPGSGAFWKHKGDVRTKRWLIEMKRTVNRKSITIKDEWLAKIRTEALGDGRMPLLGFELNGRNYFIIREDDLLAEVEM